MSNPKRNANVKEGQVRSYWLYGVHAVSAALANPRRKVSRAVCTQPMFEKYSHEFQGAGIVPRVISPREISQLLPLDAVHQGVAVEVLPLPARGLEEVAQTGRPLVLLDQVSDPHNIGAILRTAAAFGVGGVINTKDNAPQESAVMAKASSGGIELVPLVPVTNLSQAMETLKKLGYWCVGLDGEARQTIAGVKLNQKTALVLGTEGRGLRRLTAERCDLLVKLPIAPEMESLNVSNAAAIALYVLSQSAGGFNGS